MISKANEKSARVKFTFKVWSEIESKPFMGPGRYRLFSTLQKTGSINAAAKEAGVSYRRAWAQIRQMEQVLGCPLVVCNRGGRAGGGTELTPTATRLLEQYLRASKAVSHALEKSGAISMEEAHVKKRRRDNPI
jgi:molybdate transport system regulatory protein